MFERFTAGRPAARRRRRPPGGRARRVMVLAQEEAGMVRHDYVAAERILPWLIREGAGLAGPGAGVYEQPGGAGFCPAGPASGSDVSRR